jgi:hypothetical protein
MSRPHHLPRMDNALAKKMEEIRRNMGSDVRKAFSTVLIYVDTAVS